MDASLLNLAGEITSSCVALSGFSSEVLPIAARAAGNFEAAFAPNIGGGCGSLLELGEAPGLFGLFEVGLWSFVSSPGPALPGASLAAGLMLGVVSAVPEIFAASAVPGILVTLGVVSVVPETSLD